MMNKRERQGMGDELRKQAEQVGEFRRKLGHVELGDTTTLMRMAYANCRDAEQLLYSAAAHLKDDPDPKEMI